MSGSWRLGAAATIALLVLHWSWAWQVPLPHLGFLASALLFSLPLLPPAIAFLLRRPRAPLWAGIAALLYFCHGIAEWRAAPAQWPWAAAETALALAMVLAAGWPGIAAKLVKRRAARPPTV